MTQEEKQLLLKDLCGRVIHNTKVRVIGDWFYEEREPYDSTLTFMIMKTFEENDNLSLIVKPYLRPMSSMTTDEEYEYHQCKNIDYSEICEMEHKKILETTALCFSRAIDWLNKKGFDYRGLIEKGLALEAPEGMYK